MANNHLIGCCQIVSSIAITTLLFTLIYYYEQPKPIEVPLQSFHAPKLLNKAILENFYKLSQYNPQQIAQINKNQTILLPTYQDPKFLSNCQLSVKRKELFDLITKWIDFASEHDIMWFLQYGSLIGAIRHNDLVPWDHDMDIAVFQKDESLIRKLADKRPISSRREGKPYLVVRPGAHCPYNGRRQNCQGNMVTTMTDGCAFCGPLARYFYQSNLYIDIYLVNVQISHGRIVLADEGMWEYSNDKIFYPIENYFPLTVCKIMNLTLPCPNDSKQVLKRIYKNYQSKYKCSYSQWVKI